MCLCEFAHERGRGERGWEAGKQRELCLDKCKCRHTEIKTADHTRYVTKSQHCDTDPADSKTDYNTNLLAG